MYFDATATATDVLTSASGELTDVVTVVVPGLIAFSAIFWAVRLVLRKTGLNKGAKL